MTLLTVSLSTKAPFSRKQPESSLPSLGRSSNLADSFLTAYHTPRSPALTLGRARRGAPEPSSSCGLYGTLPYSAPLSQSPRAIIASQSILLSADPTVVHSGQALSTQALKGPWPSTSCLCSPPSLLLLVSKGLPWGFTGSGMTGGRGT